MLHMRTILRAGKWMTTAAYINVEAQKRLDLQQIGMRWRADVRALDHPVLTTCRAHLLASDYFA